MRAVYVIALSLLCAACQGDSGNVMASSGNALTPAQVDAALGPELANIVNDVATPKEVNTGERVGAADAVEPNPRVVDQTEPEPEKESPEPVPSENNSTEE